MKQSTGIGENKWLNLDKINRCITSSIDFPAEYWPLSYDHSNLLCNITPSKPRRFITLKARRGVALDSAGNTGAKCLGGSAAMLGCEPAYASFLDARAPVWAIARATNRDLAKRRA